MNFARAKANTSSVTLPAYRCIAPTVFPGEMQMERLHARRLLSMK